MVEIVTSMKEIEKKDWNNIAGKDKVETMYEWFSFAENVVFERKVNFCHAVYKDEKGDIRGIFPASSKNMFIEDLFAIMGLFSFSRSLPKVKTPFTITDASLPLSIDSRYFGDRKYFGECLRELELFSRKNHHSLIIMRGSNERTDIPGYLCIELYPDTYMGPHASWDAYIRGQRGRRGKHIQYEYRKSVEQGTKTYMSEGLDGYCDVLHRLYMNVYAKNEGGVIYTSNYFKKMDEYLHQHTKCLFAENEGEITGYLLLLENDHFITCKLAGRDYSSPDPFLYFRLMYELIKYAIEKKKPISMEKTMYDAKLRRGFTLKEKRCYMKSNYPVIGDVYLTLVKMWNRRVSKHIECIKSLQD